MSTSLQLEGPDIETVLTQVRDTHGTGARIIGAEKVRHGGFAGFFTRERFEVSIELPDVIESGTDVELPTGPRSLLELSDAVSSQERAEQVGVSLSTGGQRFAAVMSALGRAAGAAPLAAPAPVAVPALTGRWIMPAVHVIPALEAPAAVAVRVLPVPALPVPALELPVLACPVQPPMSDTVAQLVALGLPAHLVPMALRGGSDDVHHSLVTTLSRELPAAPRPPTAAGEVLAVVGDGVAALEIACALARDLGLDERTVLVVAPASIRPLVRASRRLSTADDVVGKAEELGRLPGPSIVVVEARFSLCGADRARALLAALGASACWAVVDASRKSEDVGDWLGRLGRVDALALEDCGSTRDPASLLGLGRPVALLDRRRATPAAWAGMLCARLAGEVDE